MRIDMKREAEVNQRKGLTWRTVLSLIWFVLCLIFAFFFTGWLIKDGILDKGLIYGTLSLPTELSMEIVRLAAMLILVVGLQFVAVVFFAIITPQARERSGQPTAAAQSVDYYERQYSRRG
jgi:energy-coupling factor transporter transmembrane protein EcfT